jgi:hypothetical protein
MYVASIKNTHWRGMTRSSDKILCVNNCTGEIDGRNVEGKRLFFIDIGQAVMGVGKFKSEVEGERKYT